jgi:hypothetical protein
MEYGDPGEGFCHLSQREGWRKFSQSRLLSFYERKGKEGAIIIVGPSWCGWGGEASAKTGEGLFISQTNPGDSHIYL